VSEVKTGLRAILSHPLIYELWSGMVGGKRGRSALVREYVRPAADARVLDLGCGPGELRPYLPSGVSYVGIDISPTYIARAHDRFGSTASFRVGDATAIDHNLSEFDLVLAFGVLHHLSDDQASELFHGAARALKPDGRLIAVDPAHTANQGRMAAGVIARDRGQHVRTPEEYVQLAARAFAAVDLDVRGDLLRIPYTHCILDCRDPKSGSCS
jgi:SAM-dependent methyltransferase